MSSYRGNDIKALSEWLRFLQITDEASGSINDYTAKMSSTPASVPIQENNKQTGMPKSMVPDPGWFDRNRMKFEDWWKEI